VMTAGIVLTARHSPQVAGRREMALTRELGSVSRVGHAGNRYLNLGTAGESP
jgi:hypothetical protein